MQTQIAEILSSENCPIQFSVVEILAENENPVLLIGYSDENFVFELLPPQGYPSKTQKFLVDYQGGYYSVTSGAEILEKIQDELEFDLSDEEGIKFLSGQIAFTLFNI